MTLQLHLPFPDWSKIPAHHVEWLAHANAGTYSLKKYAFYPFKTRFLKKYARPAGNDLQVIVRKCYCGDGIFRGIEWSRPAHLWETCWRCRGTKIYRTDRILLSRWELHGHIFHCPEGTVLRAPDGIVETIHGLVKHEQTVPNHIAIRCFRRLLLRYEPLTLWKLETDALKARAQRMVWRWESLRRAMKEDAGTLNPEDNYDPHPCPF